MITATGFASLLALPAFVFFACVVVCYVYWPEPIIGEEQPVPTPAIAPALVERVYRSAWKGYSGLLVEGIRPDIAAQVRALLARADSEYLRFSYDGSPQAAAVCMGCARRAIALTAAAYRHPSPPPMLAAYGYGR